MNIFEQSPPNEIGILGLTNKKLHSWSQEYLGDFFEKLRYEEQVLGSLTAKQGAKYFIVPKGWEKPEKQKLKSLFEHAEEQVSYARSYEHERPKQILRWLATVIFQKYGGVEIQCYWDSSSKVIYISSNQDGVNSLIQNAVQDGSLVDTLRKQNPTKDSREARHYNKLFKRDVYEAQGPIKAALDENRIVVPNKEHKDYDLHAERRIREKFGKKLDPECLGGVKRPCLVCAHALGLVNGRPGPLWTTSSSMGGLKKENVLKHALFNGVITYITYDRINEKLSVNIDSDSESDVDEL